MIAVKKTQTNPLLETEKAIDFIKTLFSKRLSHALNLYKVSAPSFVLSNSGINDDLNGVESPVTFMPKSLSGRQLEVVHSLAKWKRMRLAELGLQRGEGLITDMRALRPDEEISPIHSIFVDQWDWEKRIGDSERTLDTLKQVVDSIYEVIYGLEQSVVERYELGQAILPSKITFIHSEDLIEQYPDLTPKEREHRIVEKYKAVFLIGIGGVLKGGSIHDGRAPDYDDWSTPTLEGYKGLNGDILVWHPVLKQSFELSSMGIRVDAEALKRQLEIRSCSERMALDWHKALISGKYPSSIGGGIGQSRLCMFLLRKRHIGEVQVSVWPKGICSAEGEIARSFL